MDRSILVGGGKAEREDFVLDLKKKWSILRCRFEAVLLNFHFLERQRMVVVYDFLGFFFRATFAGLLRRTVFAIQKGLKLVLRKVIFEALGLTKVPFGDYYLFFLGFLSKSKL